MKKIFLFLFSLFITTMAFAYDAEIDGIYYYFDDENKTAIVTYGGSSNKYSGNIIIPEKVSYNGVEYSVTSIGRSAFYNCTGLTSIEIPNSVTSIEYGVFEGCTGLTSVTIGSSVTSIGDYAFEGCTGLTSIEIPNSVTEIGYFAFRGCDGLISVIIGNGVTKIGDSAFDDTPWFKNQPDGCIYMGKCLYSYKGSMPENTHIDVKEGTTMICEYAFSGCDGLTSIEIPNSVIEIGYYAFSGCTGLTSIEIPNSVTEIGENMFYRCTNLISVTIGSSVTSIGKEAFRECTGLTSIEIPNSVTVIRSSAFSGCKSLSSVYILDIVTWCNIGFGNASANPLYYAKNLYLNNTKVTDLIVPKDVASINNYVFYNCDGLTSIEIPNSVTKIGGSAFNGCDGLTSIEIPNSVTSIGDYAFEGCTGLTSIEIPNSVTEIGYFAFRGCDGLISVIIGNGVTSIGENIFYSCTNLTSVTIGSSVTSIEKNAFENCSSLSSIKWNAKKCNDFTSKENPFASNPITSFTCGDSVEYIPAYLCYCMKDLNSVVISNSVIEIGDFAFYYCDKLRTVEIGNSLETIGRSAFSECTAIYSISIDAIIPPIVESLTFSSVSRTAQIKVPCNAVAAYQASTYWNEFTNYIESPYSLSIKVNDNSKGIAVIIKQNSCTDVTAQVQAQALPGYEFVKWSDGFTENPHTLFVTENMTITAEFRKIGEEPEDKPGEEEKHNNFIVESADKTQGAVEITITAKAIEGFEFDHWSDGSTENPRVVTLDADVELYAYFRVAGTGLENSVISSANVYGNNGTLYVEGAETDYYVLDAAGRLVYSGRESALSLPRGVYVVNVGGEVQKVVI